MLNTEAFTLLAGNPQKWDDEIRAKVPQTGKLFASDELVKVQESQFKRGRLSAELSHSIYGWSVRSGSGLQGWVKLSHNMTHAEAIEWGKAWANEDPDNREFYVRNDLLKPQR